MIKIAEVYYNNMQLPTDEKFTLEFDNFFNDFIILLIKINNWEYDSINLKIKEFLIKNNIKFPILGKPIRYLLTNSYHGPSITDIFMILGKKDSLERLNRYKI